MCIVVLGGCGAVKNPNSDASVPIDAAADAAADAGAPPLNRQRIVYSATDPAGASNMFSLRLDGTDKKQVTFDPTANSSLFGSATPDGKHVVYTTTANSNEDVVVVNADGTGLRRLTTATAGDFRPGISSDGASVSFLSDRDGANFNVYVTSFANGEAGGIKRLTMDANSHEFPSMSVHTIVYADLTSKEVMAIKDDGTGLVNLTNNAASDSSPVFSHDGKKIAFSSDRTGTNQIWIMNADGSQPVQVTTDAIPLKFFPAFDLTDQHIVYMAGQTRNLFITTLDGQQGMALTVDGDKVREMLSSWVFAE